MYRLCLKRALDVAVSMTLLVVLAPLLMLTALAVRMRLGTPILWVQQRPGRLGRPFALVKFRSLTSTYTTAGDLLPDSARMTRFGSFLRTSSLDELPELWNVLSGDMSLVGPRPLLVEYLERYTSQQARRHEVKPGITGLAQVSGRNELTWEQKFTLDVEYVDHYSFAIDVKLLALTVYQVARRKGITQPGHATTERFHGTVAS